MHIQGFQSHSDSTIEFDKNVTAIIGLNNLGKSSILKALRKAVRNVPDGKSFITSIPEEASVSAITVYTDQAEVVQRVGRGSNPKDNMYIVRYGTQCSEFTKFHKTGIPEEVKTAFGFSSIQEFGDIKFDLNFQVQRDNLFLVTGDSLSSVRSKVISRITGVDKIQRAIQLGRLKENNLTQELSSLQERRQELLLELEQFKDLDQWLQAVDLFESKIDELSTTRSQIDEYKDKLTTLENLTREARQIKSRITFLSQLPSMENIVSLKNNINTLHSLENVVLQIDEKEKLVSIEIKSDVDLLKSLKITIEICKTLCEVYNREGELNHMLDLRLPEFSILSAKLNYLSDIKTSYSSLLKIVEEAKVSKNSIESLSTELKDVEEELYNYKKEIGICPTCQQPFKL